MSHDGVCCLVYVEQQWHDSVSFMAQPHPVFEHPVLFKGPSDHLHLKRGSLDKLIGGVGEALIRMFSLEESPCRVHGNETADLNHVRHEVSCGSRLRKCGAKIYSYGGLSPKDVFHLVCISCGLCNSFRIPEATQFSIKTWGLRQMSVYMAFHFFRCWFTQISWKEWGLITQKGHNNTDPPDRWKNSWNDLFLEVVFKTSQDRCLWVVESFMVGWCKIICIQSNKMSTKLISDVWPTITQK